MLHRKRTSTTGAVWQRGKQDAGGPLTMQKRGRAVVPGKAKPESETDKCTCCFRPAKRDDSPARSLLSIVVSPSLPSDVGRTASDRQPRAGAGKQEENAERGVNGAFDAPAAQVDEPSQTEQKKKPISNLLTVQSDCTTAVHVALVVSLPPPARLPREPRQERIRISKRRKGRDGQRLLRRSLLNKIPESLEQSPRKGQDFLVQRFIGWS